MVISLSASLAFQTTSSGLSNSVIASKLHLVDFFLFICSRRAVVSYWRKYVHEVLVNRLGGLSLPRKSVVRLTDRPDMTLDFTVDVKQQYNTIHMHLLLYVYFEMPIPH